jgi:alanine racemase
MAERAVARVDLGAITANAARLAAALVPPARLCAVVKADGYGHGAVPAARAALGGGAEWLAVATAAEAAGLRAAGLEAPILVMGALSAEELDVALDARADIVAWHPAFVRRLAADGRAAGVHVKLDTGMGRLGTRDPEEALELARAIAAAEHLRLAGAMTHFATADDPDESFMREQLRRFRPFAAAVKALEPAALAHACNSAATLRLPEGHLDMVRCGIALYGLDPFGADPSARELVPALELSSYVAAVKPVEPGQSAGYGRRFVAQERALLATIPIGYGDGVRRGLTNDADVLIGGRRHPLAGTVSMDNVTALLEPGSDAEIGDPVILIGSQGSERVLAEEWARRLGTINYEVACGISARVPRRHHGGGRDG